MTDGGGIRAYGHGPVFDDRGATGTEYLGVHPEPWRETPVRHPAACVVPAAAQVLLLALRPDMLDLAGPAFWMSTGVLLAGCAVGLLLDRLVWTS